MTLFDISGAYGEQGFNPGGMRVDLRQADGLSLYCSQDNRMYLKRLFLTLDPCGIHWIDSGDYHYLTYFFLDRIEGPFDLLLFDNHPDTQASSLDPTMLSCGDWVAVARRDLPQLNTVYVVGAELTEAAGPAKAGIPDGPGLPLYISIDKDCLSEDWARTDWDQGSMELSRLKQLIADVSRRRTIIGVDICGELSSGKGACGQDVEINLRTNRELLELLVNLRLETE